MTANDPTLKVTFKNFFQLRKKPHETRDGWVPMPGIGIRLILALFQSIKYFWRLLMSDTDTQGKKIPHVVNPPGDGATLTSPCVSNPVQRQHEWVRSSHQNFAGVEILFYKWKLKLFMDQKYLYEYTVSVSTEDGVLILGIGLKKCGIEHPYIEPTICQHIENTGPT